MWRRQRYSRWKLVERSAREGLERGAPVKIGVFDSGLGGLTVLKELLEQVPNCSYVYFGDTAHVPYGDREAEQVIALVTDIAKHLEIAKCDALILACNTSSALALSALRTTVSVPVLGVIEAACSAVFGTTRNGRVAILANPLTASSGIYGSTLRLLNQREPQPWEELYVLEQGCPELVPIVERGEAESEEAIAALRPYIERVVAQECDTIVLGCTHYPLLLPALRRLLKESADLRIEVVNPAHSIPSLVLSDWLPEEQPEAGTVRFEVSGEPETFNRQATRFLGREVEALQTVLGTLLHPSAVLCERRQGDSPSLPLPRL